MRFQSYNASRPNYVDPKMVPFLAPGTEVDTVEPVLTDDEKAAFAWETRKAELSLEIANRLNGPDPRIAADTAFIVDIIRMQIEAAQPKA